MKHCWLYRKIGKSEDDHFGKELVLPNENPFENNPGMICFYSQQIFSNVRRNFGLTKVVSQLAGINMPRGDGPITAKERLGRLMKNNVIKSLYVYR